jgi:putative membrane protein
MANSSWNDWYAGWGWFLWIGVWFLLISSFGNWGYTYQAHRRYRDFSSGKDALDFLSERYAKGEIQRDEFLKIKDEIYSARRERAETQRYGERQRRSSLGAPMKST